MEDLATSGFELRFDLAGRAAVRVAGGPVGPATRRDGPAAGAVGDRGALRRRGRLAARARGPRRPRGGAQAARAGRRTRGRHAPAGGGARQLAPLAADLLERLTHRLRTDVTTLQAVADGAVKGLFEPADLELLPGELERSGREAQRRLTAAREVMGVLTPGARSRARADRGDAARPSSRPPAAKPRSRGPAGEIPRTLIPGPGWAACARRPGRRPAARECSNSDRTGAGGPLRSGADGTPVEWTERTVGELAHVGHIVAAAGGFGGRDGAVRHPPDAARRTAIWLIGTAERSGQLRLAFRAGSSL